MPRRIECPERTTFHCFDGKSESILIHHPLSHAVRVHNPHSMIRCVPNTAFPKDPRTWLPSSDASAGVVAPSTWTTSVTEGKRYATSSAPEMLPCQRYARPRLYHAVVAFMHMRDEGYHLAHVSRPTRTRIPLGFRTKFHHPIFLGLVNNSLFRVPRVQGLTKP